MTQRAAPADLLSLDERLAEAPGDNAPTLTLDFDTRCRGRFRAALDDGREVAVTLPRGGVLRGGDGLRGPTLAAVRLVAAPEAVSTVHHRDARQLARAAYHLGNRHVPLELGEGWLRYRADHVLDGLCRGLGLTPQHEEAPFEPEAGAYGAHHHGETGHGPAADHRHD